MSALEQIQALFEYNEWADEHVLNAASALSESTVAFGAGKGWNACFGQDGRRPRLDNTKYTRHE